MAIRWDKLTIKAQEAVQAAGEIASNNGNPEILPLHLLAALAADQCSPNLAPALNCCAMS
jgi:ATP-dependent Clp protease ATP-binding subunit ClpB